MTDSVTKTIVIRDKIAKLSATQRKKVEERAAEIIAEEIVHTVRSYRKEAATLPANVDISYKFITDKPKVD